MTVRGLLVGAFSVAACLAVSAAFSDASAEMKKKGGGVGICVSKPQPQCNFFLHPVCLFKSKCGGCQAWACLGYGPQQKKK
jgi:hypothetical protein